jgi:hypothetical protein
MAKYEVLQVSYINDRIVQVGDTVDYEGEPGPNLRPMDKAATKAVAESLPPEVATLVGAIRLHAASRGVPPEDMNQWDVDAVIGSMDPKPEQSVLAAAISELKLPA